MLFISLKIRLIKYLSKIFALFLILFSERTIAQTPPMPSNDDVNDEFPIDSPIIFIAVAACLFAYFIFLKHGTTQSTTPRKYLNHSNHHIAK